MNLNLKLNLFPASIMPLISLNSSTMLLHLLNTNSVNGRSELDSEIIALNELSGISRINSKSLDSLPQIYGYKVIETLPAKSTSIGGQSKVYLQQLTWEGENFFKGFGLKAVRNSESVAHTIQYNFSADNGIKLERTNFGKDDLINMLESGNFNKAWAVKHYNTIHNEANRTALIRETSMLKRASEIPQLARYVPGIIGIEFNKIDHIYKLYMESITEGADRISIDDLKLDIDTYSKFNSGRNLFEGVSKTRRKIESEGLYKSKDLKLGGLTYTSNQSNPIMIRHVKTVLEIIRRLLIILAILRYNKISHNNIKPENIMVKSSTYDKLNDTVEVNLKLIDFVDSSYENTAPEKRNDNDSWGIGMVIYGLIFGGTAFDMKTHNESLTKNSDSMKAYLNKKFAIRKLQFILSLFESSKTSCISEIFSLIKQKTAKMIVSGSDNDNDLKFITTFIDIAKKEKSWSGLIKILKNYLLNPKPTQTFGGSVKEIWEKDEDIKNFLKDDWFSRYNREVENYNNHMPKEDDAVSANVVPKTPVSFSSIMARGEPLDLESWDDPNDSPVSFSSIMAREETLDLESLSSSFDFTKETPNLENSQQQLKDSDKVKFSTDSFDSFSQGSTDIGDDAASLFSFATGSGTTMEMPISRSNSNLSRSSEPFVDDESVNMTCCGYPNFFGQCSFSGAKWGAKFESWTNGIRKQWGI